MNELVEIHIAVDESGDAGPYQDRWGELTAAMTALHREVLASGYPPPGTVTHLAESWLQKLDHALAESDRVLQEQTSVDSGLSHCVVEAQAISTHLRQSRENGGD